MKARNIFLALGLALTMGIGLAAASLGGRKAEPAKADAFDTWGFGVYFSAAPIPESYKSECHNFRIKVWGTNIADEVFYLHETGVDDLYAANLSFNDSQVVTGACFYFEQNSDTKQSTNVTFGYSKDSDFFGHVFWNFSGSWDGAYWQPGAQGWSRSQIHYYDTSLNEQNSQLSYDAARNMFYLKNLEINSNNRGRNIEMLHGGTWDYTFPCLYEESFLSGSDSYFSINEDGVYDIFILNECKDNGAGNKGIVEVIKHEDSSGDYIYYVTQSSSATGGYLYTYGSHGGSEEFCAWPGTAIASIPGVEEYFTDSGDFKYHGSDGYTFNRAVYKIPVVTGYPHNDMLIINNGVGAQSSSMGIAADYGYYWVSPSNSFRDADDGLALEVIIAAEELRKVATDLSVCVADPIAAGDIYDFYDALTSDQKALVDGSQVYTWKNKDKDAKIDVSYADVMYQIGVRAGKISESNVSVHSLGTNNVALIAIIATASIITVSGGVFFYIYRKKKHN